MTSQVPDRHDGRATFEDAENYHLNHNLNWLVEEARQKAQFENNARNQPQSDTRAWVPNLANNAKRKREYEEACASERRFFDHQDSNTQGKPRNALKRNCDGKSKLQRQIEKKPSLYKAPKKPKHFEDALSNRRVRDIKRYS